VDVSQAQSGQVAGHGGRQAIATHFDDRTAFETLAQGPGIGLGLAVGQHFGRQLDAQELVEEQFAGGHGLPEHQSPGASLGGQFRRQGGPQAQAPQGRGLRHPVRQPGQGPFGIGAP